MNWGLASYILLAICLGGFFLWVSRSQTGAKDIAVMAALAAVAALGRIPFAAVPSVQPTTFLVMATGLVFGPQAGFLIGAMAALISNFFLGQGPWSLWQMGAWGLVGISAGCLGRLKPGTGRTGLAVLGFIWGYLFGWIMNISTWITFTYPLTWAGFLTTCVASFWFDTLHALSNAAFSLVMGSAVIRILQEYRMVVNNHECEGGCLHDEELKAQRPAKG